MQQNSAYGKFIALSAYNQKVEKSKINNMSLHYRQSEKEEQMKSKVRIGEIIKTRAENKFKIGNQQRKINETQSSFFEKINKIDKSLAKLRQQVTNVELKERTIPQIPWIFKGQGIPRTTL